MNTIKTTKCDNFLTGFKLVFISKSIHSDKRVEEFAEEISSNAMTFGNEFANKLHETHTNIICTPAGNHIVLSIQETKHRKSAYISVNKANTYSSDNRGYSGTFSTNLLIRTHNNLPIYQFIPAISWTCNECAIKRRLRVVNTSPIPKEGQNLEIPLDNY
jgi:hypothetical protein